MTEQGLKIGDTAPGFSLKDTEGNVRTLESFGDKKALLVIFSCNHCPYVQAYENRIKDIQAGYADKGLQVIAINSNEDENYPEDSYEEMVKRAKEQGFNFPYLRDDTQETAKAYSAAHTPQLFLFDEGRKLAYTGKIDDNWQEPEKVQNRYLRNALDELLDGQDISVPETFAIGCTIKWKN